LLVQGDGEQYFWGYVYFWEMGLMEIWGNRGLGRKAVVVVLALVVGLAVVGPASGGLAQDSPAEKQYGGEPAPAPSGPTPEAEPDIFLPPTVESAGQEDSGGLLPFTGAALIVPSVLGGLLLAGGLFLVYRTRRRET
jgi:hypothetical protein